MPQGTPSSGAVLDLAAHDEPIGLLEQAAGRRAHDQRRHQVLEHRSRPGDQRRAAADRRHRAAEPEPVPGGHVALGDGEEARQPRLGGEQVVAVGVERRLRRRDSRSTAAGGPRSSRKPNSMAMAMVRAVGSIAASRRSSAGDRRVVAARSSRRRLASDRCAASAQYSMSALASSPRSAGQGAGADRWRRWRDAAPARRSRSGELRQSPPRGRPGARVQLARRDERGCADRRAKPAAPRGPAPDLSPTPRDGDARVGRIAAPPCRGRRWRARAGGRRDCRCRPTRHSGIERAQIVRVVPVVEMAAKALQAFACVAKRRFEALDASRACRSSRNRARRPSTAGKADIGRRGAVGDDGVGILLEIVRRQHVVVGGHEGLEVAPGAPRDQPQRSARRRRRPPDCRHRPAPR